MIKYKKINLYRWFPAAYAAAIVAIIFGSAIVNASDSHIINRAASVNDSYGVNTTVTVNDISSGGIVEGGGGGPTGGGGGAPGITNLREFYTI